MVERYDELHPIHVPFQAQKQSSSGGTQFRYVARHVMRVSEEVVMAHVARVGLDWNAQPLPPADDRDQPIFEKWPPDPRTEAAIGDQLERQPCLGGRETTGFGPRRARSAACRCDSRRSARSGRTRRQFAPPTTMSPQGCCFNARISSGSTSRRRVAFTSACCSVREWTTVGISRQMRANSRSGALALGSSPARGQYCAMTAWQQPGIPVRPRQVRNG